MPNVPELKQQRSFVPWLIVGIALVLIGGGLVVLAVMLWTRPASPVATQATENAAVRTPTPTEAPAEPVEREEPAEEPAFALPSGWITEANREYGVTFAYPPDWAPAAATHSLYDPENNPFTFVEQTSYAFGAWATGAPIDFADYMSVQLTAVADYDPAETSYEGIDNLRDEVDVLLTVYESKGAILPSAPLWLPPSNAGIIAATTPAYIESFDGSYRGIAYYGFIGQNDPEGGKSYRTMQSIVAIVTNGTNIVQVQYNVSLPPDASMPGPFETEKSCYTVNTETPVIDCRVSPLLVDIFQETISTIVGSLE